MEGTTGDVFEVYCTVISRNCVSGTEEDQEVSTAGLGTNKPTTWRIINTRQQC
jgi:hypothetical protein